MVVCVQVDDSDEASGTDSRGAADVGPSLYLGAKPSMLNVGVYVKEAHIDLKLSDASTRAYRHAHHGLGGTDKVRSEPSFV